jgi:hypothetical protein
MTASTPSGSKGNTTRTPSTTPEESLATCWTSAGDAAPDRQDLRSPVPRRDRIEAAAATGYGGFGLLSDDVPAAITEYGTSGIQAMLADNGIVHLELGEISYWWDDAPQREESDRVRFALIDAADALGARHLKVTPDVDGAHGNPSTGPPSSPNSRRRPTMSVHASASNSSRGPTSRPCTTGNDLSRTPNTLQAGSSSTPGTWTVRTHRVPSSRQCPSIGSSALAQRRRRGRHRHHVRGHGSSPPVLR